MSSLMKIRRRLLSIQFNAPDPLQIIANDTYTGKYFYCTCQYNGTTVVANWSITEGNSYATINTNGRVDIIEGTTSQPITIQCTYGSITVSKTITVSYDNQLVIECSDVMTGTSGNAIARYNSTIVSPTWSIINGSQYATIDQSGAITITESGSITLQAVYSGKTVTKNVSLVYESGTASTTEVNDDGSVTTTTTTTTTDPETGATTETSTSQTVNEDGSTSSTTSETTTNTDGSSTTNSTTTNMDGSSSHTQSSTNSDGISGTSTTTNYDENGEETGHSNTNTDTSGNAQTQEVTKDAEGNDVVTGYTIDTSGNTSGGGLTPQDGVNTGVIAFDGRPFTIHLKARWDGGDQTSRNYLIGAWEEVGNTNKYNGFGLRHSNTYRLQLIGNETEKGTTIGGGSQITVYANSSGTGTSTTMQYFKTNGKQTYTIDITYTPKDTAAGTEKQIIIKINKVFNSATNTSTAGSIKTYYTSKNTAYIPNTLENAKIYVASIGIDDSGERYDMVDFEILEFYVTKEI